MVAGAAGSSLSVFRNGGSAGGALPKVGSDSQCVLRR